MREKVIRGRTCHVAHRICHMEAKSKCMEDYDKNKDSLYLTYWDANNFNW